MKVRYVVIWCAFAILMAVSFVYLFDRTWAMDTIAVVIVVEAILGAGITQWVRSLSRKKPASMAGPDDSAEGLAAKLTVIAQGQQTAVAAEPKPVTEAPLPEKVDYVMDPDTGKPVPPVSPQVLKKYGDASTRTSEANQIDAQAIMMARLVDELYHAPMTYSLNAPIRDGVILVDKMSGEVKITSIATANISPNTAKEAEKALTTAGKPTSPPDKPKDDKKDDKKDEKKGPKVVSFPAASGDEHQR